LVKLSWRAAASKLMSAVVLGIFRRMYIALTDKAHFWAFLVLRSEKLAQAYAKTSFALCADRA